MKKFSVFLKIILVVIVVVALGNVCYRKYEERVLKKEISQLLKKGFVQDRVTTSVKTIGNYAVLEKGIKRFLDDYSKKIEDLSNIIDDDKIRSILSASNYEADGPEFTNTLAYLAEKKANIKTGMDELVKFVDKNNIRSYIGVNKLSGYYQRIYNSYILGDSFNKIIDQDINRLRQASRNIEGLIDKELEVINFLIVNKNWIVRDEQIIFAQEESLNIYNNLIKDIS